MIVTKLRLVLVGAALLLPWTSSYANYDVLELPAVKSDIAVTSRVYTVRKFGDRVYATGIRGHILYSDDAGESWMQAEVPVRSSIVDITMIGDEGWAVGHGGVILYSNDRGQTWSKQYDGRQYGKDGLAMYEKMLAEDPENELLDILVGEMDFAVSQGADKPFFRIVMHTEKFGHALGAYGMLLVTFDGGKTWEHREHTVDNYAFNHLFDVSRMKTGKFFLCGEAGVVLQGDVNEQVAVQLNTPWEGSFFTCRTAADGSVVMGGLRGQVFRTTDEGNTWHVVEKPESSSVVDSLLMKDGRMVLIGQAGQVLVSSDNGQTFTMQQLKNVGELGSAAEIDENTLLIAGARGVQKVHLDQ